MIDWTLWQVNNRYAEHIRELPFLKFFRQLDPVTGEIRTHSSTGKPIPTYELAEYMGLRIKIFDWGKIYIDGSLHKYKNNNLHNYDDFSIRDLLLVMSEILSLFNIPLHHIKILRLEIGINIALDFNPNYLIRSLFHHRRKPFERSNVHGKGYYYQAVHSYYRFKIYNKTLQYEDSFPVPERTIRVEIHYKSDQIRRVFNIKTVHDLLLTPQSVFIDHLCNELREIIYYDHTLPEPEYNFPNYPSKLFWDQQLEDGKTMYYKHKYALRKLIYTRSDRILHNLELNISTKAQTLTMGGVSLCHILIAHIFGILVDISLRSLNILPMDGDAE